MLQDEIETHEMATLEEAYSKGVDWLKPDLVLLGVSFLNEEGDALVGKAEGALSRRPDRRRVRQGGTRRSPSRP